jgi:hypothetical protein
MVNQLLTSRESMRCVFFVELKNGCHNGKGIDFQLYDFSFFFQKNEGSVFRTQKTWEGERSCFEDEF